MTKNQQTLKTINYNYDALGRRVTRIVQTQNYAYTRKYVYDGNKILMELNQGNEPVAVYLHGPGIDNPIGMLRDHDGDGEFSESEVFVFTKDHLNSVRDISNLNQKLIQRYNYSAYGKVKLERIADASDLRFVENYFTYTAREWEPEVGFVCHRARCQEGNGRWMSEDPKGISAGPNGYLYVFNNPLRYNDPQGEFPVVVLLILAAGALTPSDVRQLPPQPAVEIEDPKLNRPVTPPNNPFYPFPNPIPPAKKVLCSL